MKQQATGASNNAPDTAAWGMQMTAEATKRRPQVPKVWMRLRSAEHALNDQTRAKTPAALTKQEPPTIQPWGSATPVGQMKRINLIEQLSKSKWKSARL
jgi:hypothetical protein